MTRRTPLLALGFMASAGCATGGNNDHSQSTMTASWDDVGDGSQTVARQETKIDPATLAATSPTAAACAFEAKRLSESDPETGWAMMRGCIDRTDFRETMVLTMDPWRARVHGNRKLLPQLLRAVVQNSSVDVAGDLRQLGFQYAPLEGTAVEQAQAKTEFAGRVLVTDRVKGKKRVSAELLEYGSSRRGAFVNSFRRGGVSHAKRSGVNLIIDAGACTLNVGTNYALVMRVEAARRGSSLADADAGNDQRYTCVAATPGLAAVD